MPKDEGGSSSCADPSCAGCSAQFASTITRLPRDTLESLLHEVVMDPSRAAHLRPALERLGAALGTGAALPRHEARVLMLLDASAPHHRHRHCRRGIGVPQELGRLAGGKSLIHSVRRPPVPVFGSELARGPTASFRVIQKLPGLVRSL